MCKYLIHTCNDRRWYVDKYLIPSMLEQDIKEKDIIISQDINNEGNLISTMKNFAQLHGEEGTWHLQDDIIISSKFKVMTEVYNDGLVAGFCSRYDNEYPIGRVSVSKLWYSFPCIHIPDKLAKECSEWFYSDIIDNPSFKSWVDAKKYTDSIFKIFLEDYYPYATGYNLSPNIVNHIDYLIGGSIINQARGRELVVSEYWDEPELVEQLKSRLENNI